MSITKLQRQLHSGNGKCHNGCGDPIAPPGASGGLVTRMLLQIKRLRRRRRHRPAAPEIDPAPKSVMD